MNKWISMVLLGAVSAVGLRPACGDLIWQEDFSSVADWSIIFNAQADGSSLTSDGFLGSFNVEVVNNEVAYGPVMGVAPMVAFNPVQAADYTMTFVVDSLTASVSYDIRLDLFDSGSNYLATVFGVVPQGTFVGTDTVNLGAFTYADGTALLLPKVSVFTGPDFTDQTVRFDDLQFSVVPEPASAFLGLLGLALMHRGRIRSRRHSAG